VNRLHRRLADVLRRQVLEQVQSQFHHSYNSPPVSNPQSANPTTFVGACATGSSFATAFSSVYNKISGWGQPRFIMMASALDNAEFLSTIATL
jgi:hypothetical protein